MILMHQDLPNIPLLPLLGSCARPETSDPVPATTSAVVEASIPSAHAELLLSYLKQHFGVSTLSRVQKEHAEHVDW